MNLKTKKHLRAQKRLQIKRVSLKIKSNFKKAYLKAVTKSKIENLKKLNIA